MKLATEHSFCAMRLVLLCLMSINLEGFFRRWRIVSLF